MSKCISPQGEYSAHRLDADFICTVCLVLDEEATIKELHRLRADAPPCDGGCNENTGPEESCSLHGRTTADVWEIADRVMAQRDAVQAEAKRLRAMIEAALLGSQSVEVNDPAGFMRSVLRDALAPAAHTA